MFIIQKGITDWSSSLKREVTNLLFKTYFIFNKVSISTVSRVFMLIAFLLTISYHLLPSWRPWLTDKPFNGPFWLLLAQIVRAEYTCHIVTRHPANHIIQAITAYYQLKNISQRNSCVLKTNLYDGNYPSVMVLTYLPAFACLSPIPPPTAEYHHSDSFTFLGLWVLGLAVSYINESQLQIYESRTLLFHYKFAIPLHPWTC